MDLKFVRIYVGGNNAVAYLFEEGEYLKVWINDEVAKAPDEASKIVISDKATSFEIRETPSYE